MHNVISIIGMHRSGTSMVARILDLCGLYLGSPEDILGPDEGNPMGHFEHKGFLRIDESLLSYLGGSSIEPPELVDGWEEDPGLEPITREANVLVRVFNRNPLWGWKQPRTTLVIPFWRMIIPSVRFVICLRNPLEVAQSLQKRDRMPLKQALFLWNVYTTRAILHTEGAPRIFTFYEDFFHHPAREIARILEFCRLKSRSDPVAILSAISHDLRRNFSSLADLLREDAVTTQYKLFYLGLRALSRETSAVSLSRPLEEVPISDCYGRLVSEMEELHKKERVLQLQTVLADKELALRQLVIEKQRLRNTLDAVEQTLTWQLVKRLDALKEKFFPAGTSRRRLYDSLLASLKASKLGGPI